MSDLWLVLLFALLPGAENFAGSRAAEFWKASPRRLNWALLLSASFFLYAVGAALLSYFLLRNTPETMQVAGLMFITGLLTVAAVEDMLAEAHDVHEDTRWSVLAFTEDLPCSHWFRLTSGRC